LDPAIQDDRLLRRAQYRRVIPQPATCQPMERADVLILINQHALRFTVAHRFLRADHGAVRGPRSGKRLVEAGLIEGRGATRGRTHTLSAQVYQRLGQGANHTQQTGFGPIQHEQMVLQYVRAQGRITRSEAAELCRLESKQAKRLLTRMEEESLLVQSGTRKGAYYELAPNV
jgi:hypothetical protein